MLIIVIVIIIAFALIIHGILAGIGNSHGYSNLNQTDYVDDDGTPMHRVYTDPDSTNRSGIAYSGDLRYIDGVPLRSTADFDRWRVINGHALSIRNHIQDLERQFTDGKDLEAQKHFEEWKQYYQKYRQLIVRHRLYNTYIGQHEPFIETSLQLSQEKQYLADVERRYHAADIEREIYIDELYQKNIIEQEIIDFLQNCLYKKSQKSDMMKTLAKGDSEHRKALQRAYTSLLRREIIGEKKDDSGRLITRYIIRRRKNDDESAYPQLPASVYHPELYNDLWHQIVNKAELTVGTPENLNREKNTCTFTSLTDGSVYSTSLEKCTCPAFGGKEPCKHMVKLAMHLGYYHPKPR